MEFLTSIWIAFSGFILEHLPLSPFRPYLDYFRMIEFWPQVNWFFPFYECAAFLKVWLVAVTLFQSYTFVCRWLKVIE